MKSVLGVRFQMYCANGAVSVPVLALELLVYCANRAGLVPVLALELQMYFARKSRWMGACFGTGAVTSNK